jgi:polysaccharide biosynthesis protein PslH
MHLLIISRCPALPIHLGDRLILYHLARQFAARGHTLDLLAYHDEPSEPALDDFYRQTFRSVRFIREPRRTNTDYVARLSGLAPMFPQSADRSWSPDMWNAIAKRVSRRLGNPRYDGVLLFGGVHVYEFRELLRGLPTIIVPYESYTLYLRRLLKNQHGAARIKTWLTERLTYAFERRMFEGYGSVVMLAQPDADVLHPRYGDALQVIPNGIDLDEFTPDLVERTNTIIFFGNFEYEPNADAARFLSRDIFPEVRRSVPDARLQFVGNHALETLGAQVNSQVNSQVGLQTDAGISVIGRVPSLRPYLSAAGLFVCPLRFGAGIKNKMLEAMAMYLPIVGTPLSSDGITPSEGVIHAHSAPEFAAAIVRLLRDPGLRARLGEANRRIIEAEYTWRRVAERYETLFRERRNE